MADWYGKKRVDEDLQEEDVWGVVMERDQQHSSPQVKKAQKAHKRYSSSSGYGSSSAWNNLPTAPRSNISRTHEDMMAPYQQQSSAPMSVPDWSKIYSRKKSNQVEVDDEHGENYNYNGNYQECVGGEEEKEEQEEMVPPHEYIARRLARTQISSYSMCEGVGGTLKGRDLSKLRNAILTKTGFLE